MEVIFRTPQTPEEWDRYYHLRWLVLRKPWGKDNPRDEDEDDSWHLMAWDPDKKEPLATGRLTLVGEGEARIRSMAVAPSAQRTGIGRRLLEKLEERAIVLGVSKFYLQAREIAIPFYEKQGYRVIEKSYLLFDEIQHYKMEKEVDLSPPMRPLEFEILEETEMSRRAGLFYQQMNQRRSVRQFSERAVPPGIIADCIHAAGTAPSGANKQPWHFVAVSSPEKKQEIRLGAEEEERRFYGGGASQDWLDDLAHLGTDASKPHLTEAPWLIVIFGQRRGEKEDGSKDRHYYVKESVGIATGMLITALHQAGLATLTHTPSPMDFLNDILDRPRTEFPFLILVVGYPAENTEVPDISRKPLKAISSFFD